MIEVIDPILGTYSFEGDGRLPFKLWQSLIGGYVECVTITGAAREGLEGQPLNVLCNEDGLRLQLPRNPTATARFQSRINVGSGAVGTGIVLSGEDLLR